MSKWLVHFLLGHSCKCPLNLVRFAENLTVQVVGILTCLCYQSKRKQTVSYYLQHEEQVLVLLPTPQTQ